MPPYDILRKMFARLRHRRRWRAARFQRQIEKEKKRARPRRDAGARRRRAKDPAEAEDTAAMQLIPIIELCRYCPGMVTAMGVSDRA